MDFQVLAHRGKGGYRQYRIPAMGVTPSGRIIAIYDARPDLDDLPSPVDLVIRTSDDNGTTWTPQRIFQKSEGISGFGDPSIVIDPSVGTHGRILVLAQATHSAGFFESGLGSDPDDRSIVHIVIWKSDDDGESWSRSFITSQLKDERTPGIFATSGMGARLTSGPHAGRIVHGFVLRREGELLGALGYSDDHGDTWSLGALIPGGNETAVAALTDRSILVHSRATPYRLSGRSLDGGQTLAELAPDQALPDPSDNGSLCTLSNGDVICTHNHDSELRRNTVIKRSHDGGRTWPEAAVIELDSSAYSTSCELADGRIAVLFERHGYTEMVFCRVEKSDFGSSGEVLKENLDENGIEFTIAFRFVRPGRIGRLEKPESELHYMPTVDMSLWKTSSRKEVGASGGSTSGDPIYTWDELDQLLAPIAPGLHAGDEMRFSGRLAYQGEGSLHKVTIENFCDETVLRREVMNKGERIVFLDLRHVVTKEEVERGYVSASFTWSGELVKDGKRTKVGGEVVQKYSTSDGLLLA